jgi:uncharacterized iron-regulated protein
MKSLVFLGLILSTLGALAAPGGLYSAVTQRPIALDQALSEVRPGTVVIIGENHGLTTHQTQQVVILRSLDYIGYPVSVGMEFFSFPDQDYVDQYRAGTLSEPDFLKDINWGAPDFSYYRAQTLYPDARHGAATVALNAPRTLTSKVAKTGLDSLTPGELALLPPNFQVGNVAYKTRFAETVPHNLPPDALERYFTAQSIWDDTMAYHAKLFLDQHPEQILVIVVGEFHVQYGGGLPDRLRARGVRSIVTFSQIDTRSLQDSDLTQILQPSPRDGYRADFLWLAPAEE